MKIQTPQKPESVSKAGGDQSMTEEVGKDEESKTQEQGEQSMDVDESKYDVDGTVDMEVESQ